MIKFLIVAAMLIMATSTNAGQLPGAQAIDQAVTQQDKQRAVQADKDARFLSHSKLCEGPAAVFVSKCRKAFIHRQTRSGRTD